MAINMGLTQFLPILVLITVQCTISQEIRSTENINEILDKLILQTHINETGSIGEIKDLTPIVETKPGNESNIYYFKTFMPPLINFKSSNENLHFTRHANITVQSFGVSTEDHHATSEDVPFSGASKITRKSFIGVEIPKLLHGGQQSLHSEFKPRRSGDINENNYSLEDLVKKEIDSGSSTTDNSKQITITRLNNPNPQFNLLHEYPEIIIDHVTYDNDENDKNNIIPTHDPQHTKNIVNEENNEVQTQPPTRKIRFNIPEEEIERSDSAVNDSPEHVESRNYFTPEIKGLIDAIIRKKVIHDALLKQTTDDESRKQNMLLEKILQRLPETRQMTNNIKKSYLIRHERIAPTASDTLAHLRAPLETLLRNGGNHIHKSYSNVPLVPSSWEIYNRLLTTLIRMCRPDVLKRTRLVAGLIDRIMPNIDYRPIYYDMYKK